MKEIWKQIQGWPGYQVSNNGRVKFPDRIDFGGRTLRSKIVEARRVAFYKDGKRYRFNVAALMLTAFVGPRPPNQVARHLDDVRSNNKLYNLAWGTAKDNAQDAIRNDRLLKGEQVKIGKLTEKDVQKIRWLYRSYKWGRGTPALAKRFGVSQGAIMQVVSRRTWKHV